MGVVVAVWRVIVDVARFWQKVWISIFLPFVCDKSPPPSPMMEPLLTVAPLQKLQSWYTRKSPIELWLDLLRHAETFEDWEEAALHLDNLLGLDLW